MVPAAVISLNAHNMIVLIDTERLPQHPIDKAASSILTDRCIPYARGSWQQCTCCDEWNEDSDIEVCLTFDCSRYQVAPTVAAQSASITRPPRSSCGLHFARRVHSEDCDFVCIACSHFCCKRGKCRSADAAHLWTAPYAWAGQLVIYSHAAA